MKVVIVGGSDFAVEVAKGLLKRGINNITFVIDDRDDALKISSEIPLLTVVNSNPGDPEVLSELNLEKCNVFISATKKEEINILSALYAKEHNVKKIYVKIMEENTKSILKKLGIIPIDVYESASADIVLDIAEPLISELVKIEVGTLDMRERKVEDFPNIAGKKLSEINGKAFNVIAVYQDNKFQLSADTVIKDDASLITLEEARQEEKIVKELKKI